MKKDSGTRRNPLSRRNIWIRRKAKALYNAEQKYWDKQKSLVNELNSAREVLDPAAQRVKPLSSIVWAFTDGAAFVRYESIGETPQIEFRILFITVEEWGRTAVSVPTSRGEQCISGAIAMGPGCRLNLCGSINGIPVPYASWSSARYGDPHIAPTVEDAIMDFQTTLLGLAVQGGPLNSPPIRMEPDSIVKRLQEDHDAFYRLLSEAEKDKTREEEVQVFLKAHPHILDAMADVIPKQKLGEDFITDFVLRSVIDQGSRYTFVEIEKPWQPVLNADGDLAEGARTALRQTREWDAWLEKNKAYLSNKLVGLETPRFLIIIGRSKEMDEERKSLLRSYNRAFQNTELLTYDDVLSRFASLIRKMSARAGSSLSQTQ